MNNLIFIQYIVRIHLMVESLTALNPVSMLNQVTVTPVLTKVSGIIIRRI